MMTTWRKALTKTLEKNGETWEKVLACTLTEQQLDKEFYAGYGRTQGQSFTLWTPDHVYFPICYDGAEWVGCVSRNPNDVATSHQGG